MKYFLQYEETRTGGDVCEGDEGNAWPSYEDTDINLDLKFLATDRTNCTHWCIEEFELEHPLDSAFVLVARYAFGDTFSRTCGNFEFLGIFNSEEEAQLKASKINGPKRWNDYFGGFEGFEITEVPIK